jgi:phytol kinase
LKKNRGLKTGYTRKIFHFLIFTSAAVVQAVWGIRTLCLFGGATSAVIFYAILRGDGHLLYEAMAREKDAPHRTYYILAPYLATLIGGVTSNALFGNVALVGYLVTGLGDAIGEPVGTRFGKHAYRVPSFKGVPSTRSYEGSAAVFLMSFLAIILAFRLSPELSFEGQAIFLFPGLALLATVLEAISPHGWDNAVMQIVPSFCVTLFL